MHFVSISFFFVSIFLFLFSRTQLHFLRGVITTRVIHHTCKYRIARASAHAFADMQLHMAGHSATAFFKEVAVVRIIHHAPYTITSVITHVQLHIRAARATKHNVSPNNNILFDKGRNCTRRTHATVSVKMQANQLFCYCYPIPKFFTLTNIILPFSL